MNTYITNHDLIYITRWAGATVNWNGITPFV